MDAKRFYGSFLLLLFCMASIASAAPYDDDVYFREVQRDVGSNFTNISNPALIPYGGAEFLFGDVSPGLSDENMRCPSGNCADDLNNDAEWNAINAKGVGVRGSEKSHRLNNYSPGRAVMGTMDSTPHQTMGNLGLATAIGTSFGAMNLVEPAIFGGLAAGFDFAHGKVNLDYASDTNFNHRVSAMAGSGELIRESRNDCIGRLLASPANIGMVWTEAKDLCEGDADYTNASMTVPAHLNPQNKDAGFEYEDNESHSAQAGGGIGAVGTATTTNEFLSLWGYLLRQDSVGNPGMDFGIGGTVSNVLSGTEIAATLAQEVLNLRRLLGDVLFRVSSNPSGALPLPDSTRVASETVLPPFLPPYSVVSVMPLIVVPGPVDPEMSLTYAGPKWYIQQMEPVLYRKIWDLMKDYCDYVNVQPGNPYEYADRSSSAAVQYYWTRQSTIQKLRGMSGPNISITQTTAELLFYFISLEDSQLMNADQVTAGTYDGYNCDRVDPSVTTKLAYSELYNNASTGLDIEYLSLRRLIIHTLAHRIASDIVWSMLGKVQSRLDRLSGGAFEGTMKRWANVLIYRVAESGFMQKNGQKANFDRAQALVNLLQGIKAADNANDLIAVMSQMRGDRAGGGVRTGVGNNAS